MFPSNVFFCLALPLMLRRIRCNSWTMPWKRSATVWPSFISVSRRLEVSSWMAEHRWFGCRKKFLYFGMLLMISQKFYYKNHVEFVEPISSALPALIFKAYIGTNVGTRVIPQFSIAASKRVKTVEVSETKPSHPQCRYPFDSRGYGHEQHGGLPTIQHLLWREDKCRDFHWCHRLRTFFLLQPYKMLKMWRAALLWLLDRFVEKISVGWNFPSKPHQHSFQQHKAFPFWCRLQKRVLEIFWKKTENTKLGRSTFWKYPNWVSKKGGWNTFGCFRK